jgi:hypothetical protein
VLTNIGLTFVSLAYMTHCQGSAIRGSPSRSASYHRVGVSRDGPKLAVI